MANKTRHPFKTVHYRRRKTSADQVSGSSEKMPDLVSFENAIQVALAANGGLLDTHPKERIVQANDDRERVLGHHRIGADGVYGAVYEYEPNSYQAVLHFLDEEEAKDLHSDVDVTQHSVGPNQEFIRNWVMFFIKGDHVALLQSYGFGGKMLEEYFDGFLRMGGLITDDEVFRLKAQFDFDLLGRDRSRIKSVEIGDTVLQPPENSERGKLPEGELVEKTKQAVVGSGEKALSSPREALRVLTEFLGMTQHKAEQLLASRAQDTKLTVKASVVATTKDVEWKQRFYSELESVTQGLDHRDIKIRTSNGVIKGDKATLTEEQRIPMEGSLPRIADAWDILRKIYERWKEDDKLEE